MIETFLAILWLSIGLGVFSVFHARHGDKSDQSPAFILFAAIVWPAFVTAEIYRHIVKKEGGDT